MKADEARKNALDIAFKKTVDKIVYNAKLGGNTYEYIFSYKHGSKEFLDELVSKLESDGYHVHHEDCYHYAKLSITW